MRTFHLVPAVIAAPRYQIDLLPVGLPNISGKKPARYFVERETPRVSKAISPDFSSRSIDAHEWIAGWNSVRRAAVYIDSKYLSE